MRASASKGKPPKVRPSAGYGVPRADARRHEIIMAAAAEFGLQGYALTTLTDIARRMGIHTAGLYYYFESKDAVVKALLHYAADEITAYIKDMMQPPADATPIDRLKHAIRVFVAKTGERDSIACALWKIYDQIAPEMWIGLEEEYGQLFPLWRQLIEDAVEAGQLKTTVSPTLLRHMLVGSLVWVSEWYRPDEALTLDEIAESIITIFLVPAEPSPPCKCQ